MVLKILLCVSLSLSLFNFEQQDKLPKAIIETFQYAKASKILPYLYDSVSLKIEDKHYTGDKELIVTNLSDFLQKVDVSNFEVKHYSVRNESGFFIGSLQTQHARYRINCFFRIEGEKLLIHQIRIDNADNHKTVSR